MPPNALELSERTKIRISIRYHIKYISRSKIKALLKSTEKVTKEKDQNVKAAFFSMRHALKFQIKLKLPLKLELLSFQFLHLLFTLFVGMGLNIILLYS